MRFFPLLFISVALCSSICAAEYQLVADETSLPILNPAMEGRVVEKLILENSLQVLLISDPGVEQSAAGVAVLAGSWEDPEKYPGMAHFCEHMLFMGTEAYPNEFAYMQFMSDHGGKVNAFTATDRTVYMFSINNDFFEEAIDQFSHFFIDPLFSLSCINRELHAVDQEHAKNIEHDGWRQYMILKETGNLKHPHSTFSTGNAQTLSGIPPSALKEWYYSHYSADQMRLVMISPLKIEELKNLAVQHFSQVPKVPTQTKALPDKITAEQQRGHIIFIKPVKEIKQLSLCWEIPHSFASELDKKAPELVAYVLNQKGENSLTQTLKKEKLAEGLSATCDRFSKKSVFFSIDISLTDQGISQIDTAIERTFQAIARLKEEFPAYLFNEIQAIAKLNYQYQSREDAFEWVMDVTSEIPYEDLATYPIKTKIPTTFDPPFIKTFVDTLTPNECIYVVLADPLKTGIAPDTKEKWMNAEYAIKEIAPERLTAWEKVSPIASIQYPTQNPYIPTNLSLVPLPKSPSQSNIPTLISSEPGSKVFFAQDDRYHVPEISHLFTFKLPLLNNTPKSQVLSDLYLKAFSENLTPTLSAASRAGLKTSLYSSGSEIHLGLTGYSSQAPKLLEKIFSAFNQVAPSEEEFEIYRQSLASDYHNALQELPIRQAMDELDGILFNSPTHREQLDSIHAVTFKEFSEFSKTLFDYSFTEGLLYGNLDQPQAKELWTSLKAHLPSQPFLEKDHHKRQVLLLSDKYGPYKLIHTTERQGCGALLLLQEGPFTFEMRAIQQILGVALSDAFFDTLRTKQQTAYIAKAWNSEEERQLLQFFAVQSSTHSPTDLLARFELFLESFDKNLHSQVSEARFEGIRSSLLTLLKMPPENMPGMAYQLKELAFEYEDFEWLKKRIEAMNALSYKRFCQAAHQLLSRANPRRLAILVEGAIQPENDFHYELVTKEEVHAIGTFAHIPQHTHNSSK